VTPDERQLLTTLAERIRSTPPQQEDAEAAQLLRQLAQERPDTAYILAQTVLMQDFAVRNAQAQIEDLRRQLSWKQSPSGTDSGSFLGGPERGGPQYQPRSGTGSVPSVNPWATRPAGEDGPPPEPWHSGYSPSGPRMQPSQTSGFLRSAATTAAGVAGGALLFQGINSLFSGHHGGLLGGGLSSVKPADSLSAMTAVDTHRSDAQAFSGGDRHEAGPGRDQDRDSDMDADYGDDGDDSDLGF
jgi:uncharacterized protein